MPNAKLPRFSLAATIAVAALASLAVAAPPETASFASRISGTLLAKGTSDGTLEIKAEGRTDVVVRTITIEPGASTGWHHHAGQVIAIVQSGTLTRTLADCSVVETTAGTSFIEPSGAAHLHDGHNLGSEPVVLVATYLLPAGSALADVSEEPACARK